MTEPASLSCPRCQARVPLDAAAAGAKVRCPACGARVVPLPGPEEKPRGKKRRRSARRRNLLILGAALLLVLGGGSALSFWIYDRVRSDRPTVAVPVSFDTYEASEGAFRCEYPAGWKVRFEGVKDHYQLTCTRGAASIRISQGLFGSLVGDIAGAIGPPSNDPDRSPVARVHEVKRPMIADDFHDYQEEPAQTIATRFGPARRSAFTAAGTFGRKVRGYRATVLGHMTQFDVVCQCPPADWENLQPAFTHAIESLGAGTGP
jgi:DNA-directed RNA polymerase subunit RPC12/RpoP